MKFYTSIPKSLFPFYTFELEKYNIELQNNNLEVAWTHLEKAHIIGQRYPLAHSKAHWEMLKFGIRIKSKKEIFGQIPRLIFGGIKSFVGKIPVGNPGGSNVPPLKSFPISEDIKAIFIQANVTFD